VAVRITQGLTLPSPKLVQYTAFLLSRKSAILHIFNTKARRFNSARNVRSRKWMHWLDGFASSKWPFGIFHLSDHLHRSLLSTEEQNGRLMNTQCTQH